MVLVEGMVKRGSNIGLAGCRIKNKFEVGKGGGGARNFEGGIRDENTLAGSGCNHFHW